MNRWPRVGHWLQQNWLTVVIWAGTLIVANWMLLTKPIFYTHDYLHGARIAEMARGLREGQFPVIWSQNFGFGFGMPIFEFYAPLPYFAGALYYLLGAHLVWAVKLLYITVNVGTMVGMYLLAREFMKRESASLSAAFLTLASYRAMDLFARGAMSELWGIMGVAWLLAGVTQIIHQKKYGLVTTVTGGCLLALSHNITLMIAAPVVVIYAVGLLVIERQKAQQSTSWPKLLASPQMRQLVLAAAMILGLTAFYWMPAFVEKDLTQVDTYILDDYYDYHLHFLYLRQFFRDNFGYGGSGWGPDDGLSFFLGRAQWLGLALSLVTSGWLVYEAFQEKKKQPSTRQKLFDLAILACISILFLFTIFMTLGKSQVIWDGLSGLLAFVQFPWRWLGVSVCLLALIGTWGLQWLDEKWQPAVTVTLWLILVLTSSHYFQGEKYLEPITCDDTLPAGELQACQEKPTYGQVPFYIDDPAYIREEMSPVLVDYLPADFANYVTDGELMDWQRVDEATKVLNRDEQPAVLVERMHEKLYQFDLEATSEVELAFVYYPGWQLEVNGEPTVYDVNDKGNLVVALPAGESRVGLYLTSTPVRRLANWLSLVTVVVIVGEGLAKLCQKKK